MHQLQRISLPLLLCHAAPAHTSLVAVHLLLGARVSLRWVALLRVLGVLWVVGLALALGWVLRVLGIILGWRATLSTLLLVLRWWGSLHPCDITFTSAKNAPNILGSLC